MIWNLDFCTVINQYMYRSAYWLHIFKILQYTYAGHSISETCEYFYQKVYEANNYQTMVSFEEKIVFTILQRFNNLVSSL